MNKNAIVIDDDEISILLFSHALKLNNFNVISSSKGREACELCLSHQAQVIICDIFMPEMDGLETIKAIRKMNNKVLVVAITANEKMYMSVAKKFGADLAFHKSVPPQTIVNIISDSLNIKDKKVFTMDTPATPVKFNESFERCVDNPVFLDNFYDIFTSSSDEVKLMFQDTDMETQKLMLIRSMSYMVSSHNNQSSFLLKVADKHNKRNLNIKLHLYPLWLDSLIQAAKLSDPLFDIDTEMLWRKIMQSGIDHMIARY